jgi:hypothetical protein
VSFLKHPGRFVLRRARRLAQQSDDAKSELLIRRNDVDHQVGERAAETDHEGSGEAVQDELLRGSRFHPRRTGDHFLPGVDAEVRVGVLGDRGGRVG